MEWTDDAILLTVGKAGKRTLVLEVLTEHHGRRRCVTTFTGGEQPLLLPGSFLTLTCTTEGLGKPLMAKLSRITGGVIAETDTDIGIQVLTTAKDFLVTFLPLEQPAPEIYDLMVEMMRSLVAEDGRWPVHYVKWEFGLLCELGLIQGIERCRPAFRHGDAIYISPRTGAVVSREEAGAFIDKLMPLPGFLMGARANSLVVIAEAFRLNTVIFEKEIGNFGDRPMPKTRPVLKDAIAALEVLPPEVGQTAAQVDETARRQRLESMRKLTVASRASGM